MYFLGPITQGPMPKIGDPSGPSLTPSAESASVRRLLDSFDTDVRRTTRPQGSREAGDEVAAPPASQRPQAATAQATSRLLRFRAGTVPAALRPPRLRAGCRTPSY